MYLQCRAYIIYKKEKDLDPMTHLIHVNTYSKLVRLSRCARVRIQDQNAPVLLFVLLLLLQEPSQRETLNGLLGLASSSGLMLLS